MGGRVTLVYLYWNVAPGVKRLAPVLKLTCLHWLVVLAGRTWVLMLASCRWCQTNVRLLDIGVECKHAGAHSPPPQPHVNINVQHFYQNRSMTTRSKRAAPLTLLCEGTEFSTIRQRNK